MLKCRTCNGTGKETIETKYTIEERTCHICFGKGALTPCPDCSNQQYPAGNGKFDAGKCRHCVKGWIGGEGRQRCGWCYWGRVIMICPRCKGRGYMNPF